MKRFLSFLCSLLICAGVADGAVRDENATSRQTTSGVDAQQRGNVSGNVTNRTATTTANKTVNSTTNRASSNRSSVARVSSRTAANRADSKSVNTGRAATNVNSLVSRNASNTNVVNRGATAVSNSGNSAVTARAATTTSAMSETRTGAEYEQCKEAYFTCMDQFCQLKNDDYRRCSCSNRVFELTEIRNVMQDAGNQLTVFTENLEVVGMTAEQATAMKTASEGENALTSDTSSSKALLEAIMNSIRGEDSNVGGKFSDLNSINLAFDTTNAFGNADSGQIIASYNGQNLYNAVYPQCREAVKADCTDAQLQRAVTAYLMAVEQDCNTVQAAIEKQQKTMKSAVRESSALLDLARVENRQNHNSSDFTTCMNNVEAAILSEEVCGAGYHKCLDNGEFIDVSTGAPITGVENFYELASLLKFEEGVDAAEQKLSKMQYNKSFVKNFETRVKKFAEPALDKCVEQADEVWEEYLDKAMLAIYYAQKSKVEEIKQGCFDFVSACYMNGDAALTAAMKELTGDSATVLQPDKVTLTNEMCKDYINSCNLMFDEDIIADYIDNRTETDTLTACRAVVKECFDNFGGTGYENFYYPYSGLFKTGEALKWFTLYEYDGKGEPDKTKLVSECAKQLQNITSCSSQDMIEKAFGGFDVFAAEKGNKNNVSVYYNVEGGTYKIYGTLSGDTLNGKNVISNHVPRSTGVATEVYNQIADTLTTQCANLQGRFVELQFINEGLYDKDNLCISKFTNSVEYGSKNLQGKDLASAYNIMEIEKDGKKYGENMCPRDYVLNVDTSSWGACLCWENGGRRSKNGKSPTCMTILPVKEDANDAVCNSGNNVWNGSGFPGTSNWCTKGVTTKNMVCPLKGGASASNSGYCEDQNGLLLDNLPEGLL